MFGLQMIHEMDNLQREMDKLLGGFSFNPFYLERQQNRAFKVQDAGEAFEVKAALPGLDIEKLEISILGRRLTLAGEFASGDVPEGASWHRRERHTGRFEKSLLLNANIDSDQVEASYEKGLLRINLPKAASALPKKINVKVA
ncbi:Hsp20/alpha crystallin family protein [Malonomonas rubra]|uniref:Hsp20/alpha crystallin family protein n=1 Tax=Malonomonas rubra TaxID=57040 RepID=UPI0026F3544B|nr:Hsp20/alpha crystallin family protein [Malonomonas rubra]